LDWATRVERAPFIGQAALRRAQQGDPPLRFVGVEIDDVDLTQRFLQCGLAPVLPTEASRTTAPLYSGSRQVGFITSRTWSPILKKYLALGFATAEASRPGQRLQVELLVERQNCHINATIVERPFFNPERKRQ
jgi:aminomethyltransferase